MSKTKFWVTVAIVLLVASNAFWILLFFNSQRELEGVRATAAAYRQDSRALIFLRSFVRDVIKAEKEVDFETRLQLENMVRDIDDPTVLAAWQNFVGSKTQADAQNNVKLLLEVLVNKVRK